LLVADQDAEALIGKMEQFIPREAEKWIDRLKAGKI